MKTPRDNKVDSTLAFLSEGYRFVSNRCKRYGTDVFETRLIGRRAVCVMGEDAARMFYHPGRFTRNHAMPVTTLLLLQDKDSVQTLNGEAHRRRKEMFMSQMTPENVERLGRLTAEEWRRRAQAWEHAGGVVLHAEVQGILCRAVCQWAGIALAEEEANRRTREFASMIDGAGSVGWRNWKGLAQRYRTERWARHLVEGIRAGRLEAAEDSAVHAVAWYRDLDGEVLSTKVAGVELLNFLRPTVAVARYVTFAALAVHDHPECGERLRLGGDAYREWFVQEVRRYYPFFPLVGGRALEAFEWRGRRFEKGTWVLLDLYGTNHDERVWQEPERFRPERFEHWDGSPYNFIPQGGGGYFDGHRCAGEWLTVEVLKRAVEQLTWGMEYTVPEQDLRVSISRMPAIPKSGFIIEGVRVKVAAATKG